MSKNIDTAGNQYCVSYLPNGVGGYTLVKIVRDTRGFWPLSKSFKTEQEANELVNDLNADIGLTPQDAHEIMASSLRATA